LQLCLAVLIYSGVCTTLIAQTPDSRGRDFFLTFLPNEHTSDLLEVEDRDSLYIFIRAVEFPTRGTITYRNSLGNTTVSPFVISGPPGMYTFARFWEDCELETVSSARIRPQSIQYMLSTIH
jgi:hypothetical protein